MLIDFSCILAAALIVAANIIRFIISSATFNHYHKEHNYEEWKSLDSDYLSAQWEHRLPLRTLTQTAAFVNSAAWIALSVPVIQIAWILSRSGTRHLGIHVLIGVLIISGSVMEAAAGLMTVGMDGALDWMAKDFNMDTWIATDDGMGWKVLEMIHLAARGMILWIDTFEWLALSFVQILIYASVTTSNPKMFGKRWAVLGLVIGCLCWFTFICDIMRFKSWRVFMSIGLIVTIMNTFILIPLWLVMLSFRLPVEKTMSYGLGETVDIRRAESEQEEEEERNEKDTLEDEDEDEFAAEGEIEMEEFDINSIN